MERATLDLWVGFFVAAGIAALMFLALKVSNTGAFETAQTYAVNAKFDNIGGLKVRAPVKSAGVVVGRVGDIRFDTQSYRAEVVLNISSNFKFPVDTSAAIMTSGLLGEQYIALEAGAEEKMLAQGDSIKITQGAVVLENLIGQFLYNKADEPTTPQK
ncbi:outer membrane lipid asymmetry maintenance protein MlaD [Parasulfuritortus cantonensis]|uniref:Outer membrane lipid asymmetry maintenance protein MlaD n=1 Tax=Parasulfuritortus cantonensis TaxID=2528202 RepID=A0A4R1BM25_9PROT|nr:outer membrane lipid asymmetry maintenance protein MlaD [Parasulfuritortus cantonensis]TCJ18530.1 outer membrane lipid asymmetry maintenance protein MlaD [Parasulfuritortus cantonensis]